MYSVCVRMVIESSRPIFSCYPPDLFVFVYGRLPFSIMCRCKFVKIHSARRPRD